jgi:hypothetical protein
LEGPVAVAQQHRNIAVGEDAAGYRCGIDHGQVELAVAGEVPRDDRIRPRPDRVVDRGREGAVAVAQQHLSPNP